MNDQVLKRLPERPRTAVERICRCFSNSGRLAGLFITGSFARGLPAPDDLDLIAVWDSAITDERRRQLVSSCRANHVSDPDTDHFHLHGIVPEFHFMAGKEQVAQMITNFCWRGELPPESDTDRAEGLLAALAAAAPVFDPECLAHYWHKMLSEEYHAEYQVRRVHEQYASACRRLAQLCRCGDHRDLLYQTRTRVECAEHIVKALASLNRTFYWGPKWTQHQLATLPLRPPDTWERICSALSPEANGTLAGLKSLTIDAGRLIRRELPRADVDFSVNIVRHLT